ncbi:Sodium/hydrogen exchanger family [Acididesulfobacillus acetoxydans]|uniref:Sodium/hydrogen exchanger family n=1 Tax=Acididesulfobacillus acetoxydans TaxID=1561005 RepID=A0A8S0XC81_9FIRM|nr:sodium:proton antiporter [Acididesulfobacillus acetoxydans]CAA7602156.1 Sodium/hydrogen exchanger family [Acididesulfobacillus acetoxydans]CEJ08000.1 Transporter, monovalent cation:proton antiporter-2 (CPA2) protein [Acididesulfobacillus acetoxydans]
MGGNLTLLTDQMMASLAIAIVSGIIAVKLSQKIKVPDTVLFILIGVVVGPALLGVVNLQQFRAGAQFILTFGAAYILYDGGREIHLKVLNQVKISVALLATLGVIISALVTRYFSQLFLHLDFLSALLLGTVIASTDPSVLVPLFKKMSISPKLKQTIISESAFNDAAAAIMTFALMGIIGGGSFSLAQGVFELVKTAAGGIAVGALVGYLSLLLVSEHTLGFLDGHNAEIALAAVAGAYFIAGDLGFSGFMAVFTVGIIHGNGSLFKLSIDGDAQAEHVSFKDILVRILRIMIFIILGTQVNFGVLFESGWGVLLVVLLFIFVARPLTVLSTVLWDRKARWKAREVLYLMWTRETGVIPAALAGTLISERMPRAEVISAVTFTAIFLTLILQATSAQFVARLLHLEERKDGCGDAGIHRSN